MDETSRIETGLRKVLNRHGHVFQYRVLREIQSLNEKEGLPWDLVGAEVPVAVGGSNTHADFVLMSRDEAKYLVVECKRANPKVRDWCFAKAPYGWRDPSQGLALERVSKDEDGTARAGVAHTYSGRGPFHLHAEVRGEERGDSGGKGRGIADAIDQVTLASQGFAYSLTKTPAGLRAGTSAVVIPAVITTAQVWASDAPLTDAELTTGELNPETEMAARQVPWLWFEWNVSPAFRHSVTRDFAPGVANDLSKYLEAEHARGVAISSVSGLPRFLREVAY